MNYISLMENVNGKLGSNREDMGKIDISVSISRKLVDEIDKLIVSKESIYIIKLGFIRDATRLRLRTFGVKIWLLLIIQT